MRILILGGTRFLGRAITEAALGRGDTVTLFNRGTSSPGLYPGVETVTGDRTAGLSGAAGREWDAVIDVAGYTPQTAAGHEHAGGEGRNETFMTPAIPEEIVFPGQRPAAARIRP